MEWAHNGDGVRWINGLYGTGKPHFGQGEGEQQRHPVRAAMVLGEFVAGRGRNFADYATTQTRIRSPRAASPTMACLCLEGLDMFFEHMLQSRVRSGYVDEQKAPTIPARKLPLCSIDYWLRRIRMDIDYSMPPHLALRTEPFIRACLCAYYFVTFTATKSPSTLLIQADESAAARVNTRRGDEEIPRLAGCTKRLPSEDQFIQSNMVASATTAYILLAIEVTVAVDASLKNWEE
ncbi:uncharacterized protein ARMOST_04278 [Armillaria ostoyae]|uniref:Uncharacterized protein n=1 Tax=Armillaria ostoyae TaxID=47428 RepID=A0A284QWY7_ARMOS|nr:uncharacterized protein ARMOST_04278 [Armillaria ostoyae]